MSFVEQHIADVCELIQDDIDCILDSGKVMVLDESVFDDIADVVIRHLHLLDDSMQAERTAKPCS